MTRTAIGTTCAIRERYRRKASMPARLGRGYLRRHRNLCWISISEAAMTTMRKALSILLVIPLALLSTGRLEAAHGGGGGHGVAAAMAAVVTWAAVATWAAGPYGRRPHGWRFRAVVASGGGGPCSVDGDVADALDGDVADARRWGCREAPSMGMSRAPSMGMSRGFGSPGATARWVRWLGWVVAPSGSVADPSARWPG